MIRVEEKVEIQGPFSLKAVSLAHGWHELAPACWCEAGRCLELIQRSGTQAFRVSVLEAKRSSKRAVLRVIAELPDSEKGLMDRVVDDVRFALCADRDMSEFYSLCKDHPRLKVVPVMGAGRLLRSPSMTENIIKVLCSTNVNWLQAVKMINRLAQLGPVVPHFRHLCAWPTPKEILRAGDEYMSGVCRLGYRSEQILEFCDNVCKGRIDPEKLKQPDLSSAGDAAVDEARELLSSIRGIGPASTAFLLSLCGYQGQLGIDSATIAQAAELHFGGRKPTAKEVARIYEPYGRWQHLVYWLENWLTWDTGREMVEQSKQ